MIPVATTTITVLRRPTLDGDGNVIDPYDAQPAPAVLASNVRAHISTPSGSERTAGGSETTVQWRLDCDPTDMAHTDQVRDDSTGVVYDVTWVAERRGFGLDHLVADLRRVEGMA